METPVSHDQQVAFDENFGGDFSEQPEEFSIEDAEDFSEMIWNMPAMFLGEHLEPDPAKLKKFSRELHKYCSKKGIDPSEYMFDELPLMMVGGTMGLTMWKAHKDHKKDGHDQVVPEHEYARETRILKEPVRTSNDDGMIQGEKTVFTAKEKAFKPETTEYAPNEPVDMGDGVEELEFARL